MSYNLFIDDERDPPDDGREWIVARTYQEVVVIVCCLGMPSYVSFDHDLGQKENGDGYIVAKYLVDVDMGDNDCNFPANFDFYVHSQNPIGKANIEMYLKNYLEFKKGT